MTDREVMKQALEALQCSLPFHETVQRLGAHNKAITALRAALEQPEQEPYDQTALELCEVCCWKTLIPGDGCLNCERKAPPEQRKPLTEEEIKKAVLDDPIGGAVLLGLIRDEVKVTQLREAINLIARAVEQAHGIKGEA